MDLVNAFKSAAWIFFLFSWVALLIAFLPTLIVTFMVKTRRWQYGIAGLLGAAAGGFAGTASFFLSVWFACRGHLQGCHTARGDMRLVYAFPLGSFLGCVVALAWTRFTLGVPEASPWSSICLSAGRRRLRNWAYALAALLVFWGAMIFVFGRWMA